MIASYSVRPTRVFKLLRGELELGPSVAAYARAITWPINSSPGWGARQVGRYPSPTRSGPFPGSAAPGYGPRHNGSDADAAEKTPSHGYSPCAGPTHPPSAARRSSQCSSPRAIDLSGDSGSSDASQARPRFLPGRVRTMPGSTAYRDNSVTANAMVATSSAVIISAAGIEVHEDMSVLT